MEIFAQLVLHFGKFIFGNADVYSRSLDLAIWYRNLDKMR